MNLRLSKNSVKTTINGRAYKMKKWNTFSTSLEGMKLAKVIAPSFAMISDMWMNKTKSEDKTQEELDEMFQDQQESMYLLTGAVTQLCSQLEDDHFMDLVDKLLTPLQLVTDDEAKPISAWEDHFDDFPEDYDQVLLWSIKVNLLDFFMKQATFASKIGMLTKVFKTMKEPMMKLSNEDTNSK